MSDTTTQAATVSRELIAAKSDLTEAVIKTQWELKAFKEAIEHVTPENIEWLKVQSATVQKLCNQIHMENAKFILNLLTAAK